MEDRDGPAAFLREKGLDLGTEVCKKADPHVVYVVSKVYRRTEGQKEAVLDLKPHLGGDGSQQVASAVTWTAFAEGWLLASAAAFGEVVVAEGWPQSAAQSKPEVLCGGALRGFILQAVRQVSSALAETASAAPLTERVQPRVNPERGLFLVGASASAGSLQLAPETTAVVFFAERDAAAKEAKGETLPGAPVRVLKGPPMGVGGRYHLLGRNSREFRSPYWDVRATQRAEQANMDIVYHSVSAVAVVEWARDHAPASAAASVAALPAQASKATAPAAKATGKAASPSTKASASALVPAPASAARPHGTSYTVAVPVLVNKRPIEVGEELLLYQAPPLKKAKAAPKPKVTDVRSLMDRWSADGGLGDSSAL